MSDQPLSDQPLSDRRFPKSARIRKQAEFDLVYRANQFAADNVLVIKATRNDLGRTRLGLSISRKVGNAVARNRWKRAIREAFRKQKKELPTGLDLVVRPKKGAACSQHSIARSLARLAIRLDNKLPPRDDSAPTEDSMGTKISSQNRESP